MVVVVPKYCLDDTVVFTFPQCASTSSFNFVQVSRLMEWAGAEGVCLIPFGGGTSVTRALEVPPVDVEPRPVVSVDMRKASTAAILSFFLSFCCFLVQFGCRASHLFRLSCFVSVNCQPCQFDLSS